MERPSGRWLRAGSVLAAAIVLTGLHASEERPTLGLDGRWQARMDPDQVGESQRWFSAAILFNHEANVPGCWDNEGFGTEHEKARTNFNGRFWYRKTVRVPAGWQGKRVFLCIGGVHRTARTWVNEQYLGEHIGYLLAFEHDITQWAVPGEETTIALEVDSNHRPDVDPLHGACDIMDYMGAGYGKQAKESGDLNAGETDVTWGGIWGHVTLEARSEAWLTEMFVQPGLTPARVKVQAQVAGERSGAAADRVTLRVRDRDGRGVAARDWALSEVLDGARVAVELAIPDGRPWSFRSPYLYTAELALAKGAERVDAESTRFGLREIRIDGPHFRLNETAIFLNGYGDDSIFPETMAFPSDKEVYLERLRLVKSYGFNYVRHHSHMLPPEYYEACDEVGMLVSAEYPIAYGNRATTDAANARHRTIMRDAIRRHRNHPSIFNWCMGNEGGGDTLRKDFLKIVREEDPTRPFIDTDGLWPGRVPNGENRDSLDFFVIQFDLMNTPLDNPRMFWFDEEPVKPVVSHETGNFCTFPRFDQIGFFRHSLKPFWLEWGREQYARLGLLGEAERFAYHSERLYALLHKINLEALRKNPRISGYHWWLFQDFWTTSNGLVDSHYRPKAVWPDEVRHYNNDIVLLEDGIGLSYRAGQALETRLQVSNFGEVELGGETLTWRLRAGNVAIGDGVWRDLKAAQASLTPLGSVRALLPALAQPERILLEVEMSAGRRRIRNQWTSWVYPPVPARPAGDVPVYATESVFEDVAPFGAQAMPAGTNLPVEAIYVASRARAPLLDAVERGACLVLLSPKIGWVTEGTRFKQPWWHAQPAHGLDEGTAVHDHPIVRGLGPEGWLDAGFYRLIEGAQAIRIEDMVEKPGVLVRSITDPRAPRNKALLFEGRAGNGLLLVSAFNHRRARGFPENDCLLGRLLGYAATRPKPAAGVSLEALREAARTAGHPGGPYLQGFRRILRNDGEKHVWHTALEDSVEGYTCRQTKPGNLIAWETAPAPASASGPVSFVFAGGLGWGSEPDAGGYTFLVNDRPVLDFDLTMEAKVWESADGKVTLRFRPTRWLPVDALGYFYVRLAPELVVGGEPCRFGVRSKGEGSKRWFGLHPYTDLLW
jgi:hypothetical protein